MVGRGIWKGLDGGKEERNAIIIISKNYENLIQFIKKEMIN